MKKLDHPNIVKLVEVIDDPESDYFYMGMFCVFQGAIKDASGCSLFPRSIDHGFYVALQENKIMLALVQF